MFRKSACYNAYNTLITGHLLILIHRLEMVHDLGYGGEISPILAAYANQNIPKREMVIKKDKETPVRIRVTDVPDIQMSDKYLDSFTEHILKQPWYLTKQQIQDQINKRTNETARPQTTDTRSVKPRAATNRKPDSKTGVSDAGIDMDKWKTLSQDLPSSKQHAPKDDGQKGN